MNIALLLDMIAEACGDRVAIGPRQGGLTYAMVRDRARAVAGVVVERAAPRLQLAAENTELAPALLFGAAYAGVPFGALNYRLADDRLQAVLRRSAPSLLAVDDRTRPRVQGVEGVDLVGLDVLEAAEPTSGADAADPTGESIAISLFTSGTTGEPKSVLLRHRNLFSYVVGTTELASAGPDDAALISVPPYHIAGLAAVLSNTYLGRRIVYLPQFDPHRWVELAQREHVTHAMIVPTMLGRLLDVLDDAGGGGAARTALPYLRHLSYGGGRMPVPTIRRAMNLLPHVDFVNAYGLTETSSTITLLDPDDHRAAATSDDPDVARRLGSVGRPLPGVEIVVRDDGGGERAVGEVGAVWARGEQIGGEYGGRGSSLDADGWFSTNDLGWLDSDGYLFLEGRADDVIVRGGENLSPGEIEEVLLTHPAVAEVAVIGVPDPEWGEAPAAFVVLHGGRAVTAAELQAWVRERLRSSRVPDLVLPRDELPYGETGKLLRRVLRTEALERLG